MTHYCNKCRVSFHVMDKFTTNAEVSRCAEPGCGKRHASVYQLEQRPSNVRMEVEARDIVAAA